MRRHTLIHHGPIPVHPRRHAPPRSLLSSRPPFSQRRGVAPWHGWAVLPDGPLVLRGGRELIEAMKQELQDAVGANRPVYICYHATRRD